MSFLTIVSGSPSGERYLLNKNRSSVLGRSQGCEICLRDPLVSRQHARVYWEREQWWIEDHGSRNGTLVNGRPIAEAHRLERGDRLELGKTTLVFETTVKLLPQAWADNPVLSSPVQEEAAFETAIELQASRSHAFEKPDLEILCRVAMVLNSDRQMARLVRELLKTLREAYQAETACIFLGEAPQPPFQPTLVLSDIPSPKISQTVVWHSIRLRQAVCVRDSQAELPADDVLNLPHETSHSLLCAPLVYRERPIGALLVDRHGREQFDRSSLYLFVAIVQMVATAIHHARQIETLERASVAQEQPAGVLDSLTGSSAAVEALRQAIVRAAASDDPVLISGERGTGKNEVARAIHESSPRAASPLLWLNVLAIAPERADAALFGKVSDEAATAQSEGLGLIEQAHGGTLVIEHVAELPLPVQAQVLRYLQTLKFRRIGGHRRQFADARIIATAGEPLDTAVREGRCDLHLCEALNRMSIDVPPLRARADDIVHLARRYLKSLAPHADRRPPAIAPSATRALAAYSWPGNLHELRCTLERALLLVDGDSIGIQHLPGELVEQVQQAVDSTAVEDTPGAARTKKAHKARSSKSTSSLPTAERPKA